MRISNQQCWQTGHGELPYQYAKKSNSLSSHKNTAVRSLQRAEAAAASEPAACPHRFASQLKRFLAPDANGRIHEEQLPYGIVCFLLQREAPEIAERYAVIFDRYIGQGTPPLSAVDTLKLALQAVTSEGLLCKSIAEHINRTISATLRSQTY